MNAAAYVRVSSRAQDYGMQIAALERTASARGDIIGEVYSEKKSAGTLDRPELTRLRADARAGKIGRLYVYALDRLTRSGIRDTIELVQELRRHGCSIVSVSDAFNIDGPEAELVLSVLAWVSENERRRINERISAAREHMAAQGRPWGRPTRMTPELVTKGMALHAKGRSIRQIAVALKIPKDTIARAIRKAKGTRRVDEFGDPVDEAGKKIRAKRFPDLQPGPLAVAKTSPRKRASRRSK